MFVSPQESFIRIVLDVFDLGWEVFDFQDSSSWIIGSDVFDPNESFVRFLDRDVFDFKDLSFWIIGSDVFDPNESFVRFLDRNVFDLKESLFWGLVWEVFDWYESFIKRSGWDGLGFQVLLYVIGWNLFDAKESLFSLLGWDVFDSQVSSFWKRIAKLKPRVRNIHYHLNPFLPSGHNL